MKEKHAVTIAGVTLNLITEEPRENLDALASALDTRIRDLMIINKRITKTEASMFCALEFYNEKLRLTAQIRKLEAQAAHQTASINYLQRENKQLCKKPDETKQIQQGEYSNSTKNR